MFTSKYIFLSQCYNIFGDSSKTAAVDWFEFNSHAYIKANNIFPCLDQSKEVELGVSSTLKKN